MQIKIKEAREQKKMTQKEAADTLGLQLRTYQTYEQGTREAKYDTLRQMSALFGVSIDYLLGNDLSGELLVNAERVQVVPDDPDAVAEAFRNLHPQWRRVMLCVLEEMHKAVHKPPIFRLRVSLNAASAGLGEDLDDEAFEELDVIDCPEVHHADFGVPVDGDSMEPEFSDGDIALAARTEALEPGEIGLVYYNGAGYIKRIGAGYLESLNPAYDDIPISRTDDFYIFARIIGKTTRVTHNE